MADDIDDYDDLDPTEPDDAQEAAEFEAELQRQLALVPPELYEALRPLLLLASVANYQLVGHPHDPVPEALHELLGYGLDTVKRIANVHDTPSLTRVMAGHTLELFDFMLVARLVCDSSLRPALEAYLTRYGATAEDAPDPCGYLVTHAESLLDNMGGYLARDDEDLREDLRMRRLHAESIFARLDDTLRAYYPPGQSPEAEQAEALDAADEAEDQEEPAVHVSFSDMQRVTLGTALRLPRLLAQLGETAFARALAGVGRFRQKALDRLADRLAAADLSEPVTFTRSELLRLYQAAQVCALSSVADVLAAGSLEDVMRQSADAADAETPEQAAQFAHRAREAMMAVLAGFVEVVEQYHADDEEVAGAKAEISRLAELLVE